MASPSPSAPICSGSGRFSPPASFPTYPVFSAPSSSSSPWKTISQACQESEQASKAGNQLLLFTLPASPKPVPGSHAQLCRLPPVTSPHSPTPFPGTKKMLVEHLAFLPPLDASAPPSKPIPIPLYQRPIHRNTFYLEPTVAIPIRIPTRQYTSIPLS